MKVRVKEPSYRELHLTFLDDEEYDEFLQMLVDAANEGNLTAETIADFCNEAF